MQLYNLFFDTNLFALYNQNEAELNQMKVDLLIQGVAPEDIHLPVFSDSVREQLADFGINETASSSQVILDAMSNGIFDFSTLSASMGCEVALLVGLSAVFAGFETNNFLRNRIKRMEQKKNAEEEFLALSQSEEGKQQENTQEQSEKENIKL